MNNLDYSTMRRILRCTNDHQFIVAHDDPQKFQGIHVGCGGHINGSGYVTNEADVFYCTICGNAEQAHYESKLKAELIASQICFTCHFWQEKIGWRKAENDRAFVISGSHYWVDPDEPEGQRRWSGFGGSMFHIRRLPAPAVAIRLEGKEVPRDIIIHNLWHQGKVPERFRDILTDNAEFVNDEQDFKTPKA